MRSCYQPAAGSENFTIYLQAPGNLCKYFLFFALKLPASSWLVTRPDLMYFVLHAVRTYDATANFDLG